VSEGGL